MNMIMNTFTGSVNITDNLSSVSIYGTSYNGNYLTLTNASITNVSGKSASYITSIGNTLTFNNASLTNLSGSSVGYSTCQGTNLTYTNASIVNISGTNCNYSSISVSNITLPSTYSSLPSVSQLGYENNNYNGLTSGTITYDGNWN